MSQASVVTRMRTGDIRSVPLAFWLFAFLTLLYAYLLVTDRPLGGAFDVLSLAILLSPFVVATAMAWAAPADLRYLWGAALIAAAELPRLIEMALSRFAFVHFDWGLGPSPSSLTWGLELIGVALIALAIGRIENRRNWLWMVVGLGVFVIGDIENAAFWASNPYPEAEIGFVYPPLSIAITFVAGLTTLAWSFLLGAAVDHRHWLFALASGIFVALSAFGLIDEFIYGLFPPPPTGGFSLLAVPVAAITVIGWVALTLAALREVPRRSEGSALADTGSDVSAHP